MSDAIFVAAKAYGRLTIGDKHEIDKQRGASRVAFV